MRLKLAKKQNTKAITKLFKKLNLYKDRSDVEELVEKKKIKAAFSYTIIGITGICGIMYISKLGVMPEFQGQGIGSLLIEEIKELASKTEVTAFFLFSRKNAKKFYIKNKLRGIGRMFWWKKATTSHI